MRLALAVVFTLAVALALALEAPAFAAPLLVQTVPSASPSPAASVAPSAETPVASCEPHQANLGGVGRASVVAFTGAIFGDRICATVANVSLDGVAAHIVQTPPPDALAAAPLANGAGATLVVSDNALAVVAADETPAANATATVGPFVVAPGGQIPNFNGDTQAEPRTVLAYAGQRLLLIGTSPVALVDLARALRDQPDLFGADAIERAVVLAAGPQASLLLQTADGPLGRAGPADHYLVLLKR